ncbi:MAG: hypothetical protein PHQ74_01420 [Crocinitomicaceae bacterium]|nr:hypothetical protein [Crocinitomicaceae bacterium]
MKLIKWYRIIWIYAIVQINKGKGLYKMKIAEAKWWLMFVSAAVRTFAISLMSTVFFGRPQPIKVPGLSLPGENFMWGLFLFFFLPIFLFDYFLVFYKDRYQKYEYNLPIKPHSWWTWMSLFVILPAIISSSIFTFLVLTR